MTAVGLPIDLLMFAAAAAAVWIAGVRLTRYVDAIAERKRLGRAFMGLLVLATATQLPEIVTNSTAALRGDGHLVVNSMFGGIGMQTAVLVGADLAAGRHALTFLARSPLNLLQGVVLILLLALLLLVTVPGDVALLPGLGLAPIVLMVLYLAAVYLLWRQQHDAAWLPADAAGDSRSDARSDRAGDGGAPPGAPIRTLVLRSIAASAVILVAGVVLVRTAEAIAAESGLGTSFVGVTLLASATSLPELSTALAAVRLGQHSMAVADIFGSNLIMLALLLPADALYRQGPILDAVDASARFALTLGLVVTAVYLAGLLLRDPRPRRLGVDSGAVLLCYAAGLLVLYQLR